MQGLPLSTKNQCSSYVCFYIDAVVIAHVLRVRDGLSIANNRIHEILQEYDHVTEDPTKAGPQTRTAFTSIV